MTEANRELLVLVGGAAAGVLLAKFLVDHVQEPT